MTRKAHPGIAGHERGRISTDQYQYLRTSCSCGWSGSPWSRGSTFYPPGGPLSGREMLYREFEEHIADVS